MSRLPRRPILSWRLLEPRSYVERLEPEEIFGRRAPLQVDLGCGDGSFLNEMAANMPGTDFLGVERLLGRAHSSARKIHGRTGNIDNVRILRLEIFYTIRYLLPPGSVQKFYLLFPDPWPKRRHQRRRVVTHEFLDAVQDALVDGGAFHIATDQCDYFDYIRQLAGSRTDFTFFDTALPDLPQTKFERHFRQEGLPIYRLELRKTSPVA